MKAIIQLDELSCPSCLQKIESGVKKLAGIENVKVLFNASKVKVEYNESINENMITDQITNLGYEVKNVKVK